MIYRLFNRDVQAAHTKDDLIAAFEVLASAQGCAAASSAHPTSCACIEIQAANDVDDKAPRIVALYRSGECVFHAPVGRDLAAEDAAAKLADLKAELARTKDELSRTHQLADIHCRSARAATDNVELLTKVILRAIKEA